jgi:hypothetical protein
MILHFKRTPHSELESRSEGVYIPKLWRWARKPASLKQYAAATPELDCEELFVVHRCSSAGRDGIAFIMCDKDGAMCVMKKSNVEDRRDAFAALQREADMLQCAWPHKLAKRVYVAIWNSAPFLCMPLLRIISRDDLTELEIDVEAAVRAHIDKLASRGLCHNDLHWRHVACYAAKHGTRIVFIDWAQSRTDMEAGAARLVMLSALGLK